MGRLFWKFFIFFWLAQLLTSVGVGVTMWFLRPEHRSPPAIEAAAGAPAPPAGVVAEGAAPPPHHRRPRGIRPPLMPMLAGSVVSLLFAALLAWRFARPIRVLRDAFDAVAAGELGKRVGAEIAGRGDELADLGKDFDRMAGRLQTLLDNQRRLLHDVSHEMRSPLARLQAAVDLLQQQPERSAEFVARIEREAGRMDRLVGELLTLARLDAGIGGLRRSEVELGELLAELVDDARFEADGRSCRVELTVAAAAGRESGAAIVDGDAELLHLAFENIVRNAIRHSPPGGLIAIALGRDAERLVVSVSDQGPGVAAAELERIFVPFVRGAAADAGGYGLGLAITRSVINAHGGSVSAANGASGGLVVRVELPPAAGARSGTAAPVA